MHASTYGVLVTPFRALGPVTRRRSGNVDIQIGNLKRSLYDIPWADLGPGQVLVSTTQSGTTC